MYDTVNLKQMRDQSLRRMKKIENEEEVYIRHIICFTVLI